MTNGFCRLQKEHKLLGKGEIVTLWQQINQDGLTVHAGSGTETVEVIFQQTDTGSIFSLVHPVPDVTVVQCAELIHGNVMAID